MDSARKWLGLGFDGFRIDHIIGINNENLNKIISPLRLEYPKAIFIGEAWFKGIKFRDFDTINVPHKYLIWVFHLKKILYENYAGILDGILDFQAANYLEKYARSGNNKFRRKIVTKHNNLKNITPVTFLDNHDMERFIFRCDGDIKKLKKAAKMQFSIKGPTVVYYGTEIGMSQVKAFSEFESHSDLMAREPMYWDASKQNLDLLEYYKKLIKGKVGNNHGI